MKTRYIIDLRAGDELVNEPLLLYDVVRRQTKDGRPFLLATLRDRTGQLSGVFWDVPDYVDAWVRPGLAVLVTGKIGNYKDSLQLAVTDLNQTGQVDMSELLRSSARPRAEMIAELRAVIAELGEPWQTLATYLLLEGPFLSQFAAAPAARNMHHAYVGGLLEHTLSMAAVARFVAGHYRYVNKDLLMCGVLLHDMGKAMEYALEEGIVYSEDGRLVGHIVRAVVMVEKAAAELGFPEEELRRLVHLIVSHHGTHEWGSPILPKTLEAVLLHQIDLLDSRVQGFLDHVGNDAGAGDWTNRRSEMFGTELRRPPGFAAGAANSEGDGE